MKAAVVHEFGRSLVIEEVPTSEPGPGQIKVVLSCAGTRVDLAETFELPADGCTRIVREWRQLKQVNESIDKVLKGEVEARLVFDLR